MSKVPPTLEQAQKRGLLVDEKRGIHTFSNGTDWECWASGNCYECWHWDEDCAGGRCGFEGAAVIGLVSPELARMFGWIQKPEYADYVGKSDPPDSHRHGWDKPDQCAFFRSKTDDNGDDNPPPPEPDPLQLVLLADPTEDIGQVATCDPAFYPELVS